MWLEKLWYKAIKMASALAGWGFGLVGVVKVFVQIANWLKYAIWQPYTIENVLYDWGVPRPFTPNMLGVQKIIDQILLWPGIFLYILLAIGCTFVFVWAEQRLSSIESEDRRAERTKQYAAQTKAKLEEAKEKAARSKTDFDFEKHIEELLGKKRKRP